MKTLQKIRRKQVPSPRFLLRIAVVASLCGSTLPSLAIAADTPAYLSAAEAKKGQRPTVPPERFADPQVKRAYQIAKQRPTVLAQQSCYCWCSRMGHQSLLSCYQNEHASECSICMKEAFLADQLTRQGKTPEQIRQAIVRGDWRSAE